MDDPLFDPWSSVDAVSADESTESEVGSAGDARPTPSGPLPGQPTTGRQERPDRRWRPTPNAGEMPGARPAPRPRPEVESGLRPRSEPERGPDEGVSGPSSRVSGAVTERLQDLAIPPLRALEARLQIARHRTLLDDRLDRDPPTIRFRLIPRRGPFDDVSAVPGSVLEIVGDDRSAVTARFWLDPVAEEPTDERRVDAARLGRAWIDEIAMEFVEKALRRR